MDFEHNGTLRDRLDILRLLAILNLCAKSVCKQDKTCTFSDSLLHSSRQMSPIA